MSRLTIDISPEQHKSLKAMAALEGKTIRQYTLERLFPRGNTAERSTAQPTEAPALQSLRFPEDEVYEQALHEARRVITLGSLLDRPEAEMDEAEKAAWADFLRFLEQRAEEARSGDIPNMSFDQIVEQALQDERRNDAA